MNKTCDSKNCGQSLDKWAVFYYNKKREIKIKILGAKIMKTYEKFELVIVDFLENDVLTASGETETTSGVYEHVSDLSTKSDWF